MSLPFVHGFVSSCCTEKQISSTIKRKPSEVQNLLRHQIFSRDMGWENRGSTWNRNFIRIFIQALSTWNVSSTIFTSTLHPLTPRFFLETGWLSSIRKENLHPQTLYLSPSPDQPASTSFTPSPSLIQRSQASTVPLSRSCPWYSHGWAFHRTACDLFPVLFQLDLSVASDAVDLSILHEVPPRD